MSKEYVRDEYPFRNITQEEADLLCAKHVLWLHGQGGEQANFEGCSLSYLDLSHRNFAGASFRGSRIYETDLRHSRLDAADFTDAVITGGDLRYSSAQKALFRNTVLDRCLCLYTCFRGKAIFRGPGCRLPSPMAAIGRVPPGGMRFSGHLYGSGNWKARQLALG